MPSYLITGVSRGLGYEFLKQLSADKSNIVIGTVRDKKATEEKIANECGVLENVTIVQADLTDYDALKSAVPVVDKVTGGKLDYIIANAGLISSYSGLRLLSRMGEESPEKLEQDLLGCYKVNVIGNVHLFNLFLPFVLNGTAKKVITLSSGHADLDLIARYDIKVSGPYAASKGAMNIVVAKYSAEYRSKGVLFLSLSPGYVETNSYSGDFTEELQANVGEMNTAFNKYAPHAKGMSQPKDSIKDMLDVIGRASIETGYAGAFVSHFGNQQWL